MTNNPLDIHSQVEVEELGLGVKKIIYNPRDSKKGRLFMPLWNDNFPPLEEFKDLPFLYVSKFFVENNASGNHYHNVKREILVPLDGIYEMYFEDIRSKQKIEININDSENAGIYVPTGVSHKIISKGKTGVLLVLASSPSSLEDEIEYLVD